MPTVPAHLFARLMFVRFVDEVAEILEGPGLGSETVGFFTPHGASHIHGVEESVRHVTSFHGSVHGGALGGEDPPAVEPLTVLEQLILRFCAWTHDLGMVKDIAERFEKRQAAIFVSPEQRLLRQRRDHDIASADFLSIALPLLLDRTVVELTKGTTGKKPEECLEALSRRVCDDGETSRGDLDALFDSLRDARAELWMAHAMSLAYTVNLVGRYHRRAEPLDRCPLVRQFIEAPIRARLLAAAFRLADALHVDRTRFSARPFDLLSVLPEFTQESRVHWIKSFIVSSIRIDPQRSSVHVQADIPAEQERYGLREMLEFIVTDLEEDVLSVSRILLEAGYPAMLGVTNEVHEIPAMGYSDEVRAALDSMLAASSPNTSQLITITLGGLAARLRAAGRIPSEERRKYLLHEAKIQIAAIQQQRERRPCHEGLRKIERLLSAVLKLCQDGGHLLAGFHKVLGTDELISALLRAVHVVFASQRDAVARAGDRIDSERVLGECKHLVVYGYSQEVITVLEGLFRKRGVETAAKIHVLECRTKTFHSSSGYLLYHDGQRYAKGITNSLNGTKCEISLEPDVALARIVRTAQDSNEQIVLLLGSNAVYRSDGTFVHSMGHLTAASVARSGLPGHDCKVVVVTDGMKIGERGKLAADPERQRNPNIWLTHNRHVLGELEHLGVALYNWQEDEVPADLIDHLIVLDKERILDRGGDGSFVGLADMEFDAEDSYCQRVPSVIVEEALAAKAGSRSDFKELLERVAEVHGEGPDDYASVAGLCVNDPSRLEGDPDGASLLEAVRELWGSDELQAMAKVREFVTREARAVE